MICLRKREDAASHLESFGLCCNAQIALRPPRRFCKLDAEFEKQMNKAITRIGLSARAYRL
jgi:hypothetical protein